MGQSFSLPPTKPGDRYRLDELTFADTAATGGNAPIAVIGQTLVNRLLTTYLAMRSLFR